MRYWYCGKMSFFISQCPTCIRVKIFLTLELSRVPVAKNLECQNWNFRKLNLRSILKVNK